MILTTTETVPGRSIDEVLGLVYGTTVRGGHLGDDLHARLKNMVGGEIEEYTKLLAEAREQAIDRLVRHARQKGADAIVTLRFATSEIAEGAAEITVYGTAVRLGR